MTTAQESSAMTTFRSTYPGIDDESSSDDDPMALMAVDPMTAPGTEEAAAIAALRVQYTTHMQMMDMRGRVAKQKKMALTDSSDADTAAEPLPASELAPADTMLTDEMCSVAFRINKDNPDFDVDAYGTRATKCRTGRAARAWVELLVAECFRRKLGEARNWSRSKAIQKLAGSSLGFQWDGCEGAGDACEGAETQSLYGKLYYLSHDH